MPKTPSFTPQESLSKLRLLFIYHSIQDLSSPRLSPTALTDLRIALGTRICYALTAPRVAGAVCQSNMFDYRESSEGQENKGESHFGPPVSSVEVVLKGEEKEKGVGAPEPEGKIVVRGPAVAAEKGEVELEGVLGRVKGDGTVVLV